MWRTTERVSKLLFADDPDPDAGGGGGGEKKAEEKPAPTFVPTDDFKAFQQTVLDGMKSLTEGLQAIAASRVAGDPNARPAEKTISSEEYEAALTRMGTGQAVEGDVKVLSEYPKQLARVSEARVAQLEASGAESINAVAARLAETSFKHYKRYKKEIDGQLASLPAAVRMNPQALEYAYNLVVGKHNEELTKEAIEEVNRSQRDDPANASQPGQSGRPGPGGGKPANEPPDIGKVFGDDAATALQSVGKDFETMVKRMGYKNAEEYIALAKEQGVV